jgi:hypothetical protein
MALVGHEQKTAQHLFGKFSESLKKPTTLDYISAHTYVVSVT